MAAKQLDCRGMACPSPVLETRDALEKESPENITVLVDNVAARENVTRFLIRSGYGVTHEEMDGVHTVKGVKSGASACEVCTEDMAGLAENRKIMVLIATDRMGRGDDELGRRLLFNFIGTLKEMGPNLRHLIFVNGGVKLAVEGAETLPALLELEKDGVTVLVCGTCLNHFNLLEKKRVGETTNMLDIVTSMQIADSVVTVN